MCISDNRRCLAVTIRRLPRSSAISVAALNLSMGKHDGGQRGKRGQQRGGQPKQPQQNAAAGAAAPAKLDSLADAVEAMSARRDANSGGAN